MVWCSNQAYLLIDVVKMKKPNLKNWVIALLAVIILSYPMVIIYKQRNKINELSSIETPYFAVNNASEEIHKYFNYAGIVFSSYTNKDNLYGFQWVDNEVTFEIDCNINLNKCKIEHIDKKCLQGKNPPDEQGFQDYTLNQTGCITIYSIQGNFSKRGY